MAQPLCAPSTALTRQPLAEYNRKHASLQKLQAALAGGAHAGGGNGGSGSAHQPAQPAAAQQQQQQQRQQQQQQAAGAGCVIDLTATTKRRL